MGKRERGYVQIPVDCLQYWLEKHREDIQRAENDRRARLKELQKKGEIL